MAAVPIWKWVDRDQSVLEASSDLIVIVRVLVGPVMQIGAQIRDGDRNLRPVNTDRFVRLSEASGPSPDIAEHSAVQLLNKRCRADFRVPSLQGPALALEHVKLFRGVQLVSGADIVCNKSIGLIFIEWGPALQVRPRCAKAGAVNRSILRRGLRFGVGFLRVKAPETRGASSAEQSS